MAAIPTATEWAISHLEEEQNLSLSLLVYACTCWRVLCWQIWVGAGQWEIPGLSTVSPCLEFFLQDTIQSPGSINLCHPEIGSDSFLSRVNCVTPVLFPGFACWGCIGGKVSCRAGLITPGWSLVTEHQASSWLLHVSPPLHVLL